MESRDIEVDVRVYPISALRTTLATLSGRCTSQIRQISEQVAVATLTPLNDQLDMDDLERDFFNFLLDHARQEIIDEKSKHIREALVRAALREALK